MTSFAAALGFLTALPLPSSFAPPERALGRSLAWFPLVGALIGLLLAAVDAAARAALPVAAASALVLVAAAAVTGALHLDGVADACDGLFGRGVPAERRLEIMRDSRVGGFGAAGVALLLLVKYSALISVAPDQRAATLVLAGLLSRWAMVQAIALFPYAREQGLGRAFKDHAEAGVYGAAALTTLVGAWLLSGPFGLGALAMVAAVVGLAGWYAMRKLPGLTGDVYGALCEATETAVVLSAAA